MSCTNYNFQGLSECKKVLHPMSPIKGVEVIFISNKEASLTAIAHDNIRNPVTNESITFAIGGKDFKFKRTDSRTYKTTKELF